MVKFLTLGSPLLAAANWATALAARFVHGGSKAVRYVGSSAALERTGSLLFRYPTDEDPCIAFRTAMASSLLTLRFARICPALLSTTRPRNGLFCPCHHGLFNFAGEPIAGPPTRPLPRIELEQRGDQALCRREGGG